METFTLREAAARLGINQKTLDTWLKRANVRPTTDDMDRRRRLLTRGQVDELAAQFGRAPHEARGAALEAIDPSPSVVTAQQLLALEANVLQRAQATTTRLVHVKAGDLQREIVARVSELQGQMHEMEKRQDSRMDTFEVILDALTRCLALMLGVNPVGPLEGVIDALTTKLDLPHPPLEATAGLSR